MNKNNKQTIRKIFSIAPSKSETIPIIVDEEKEALVAYRNFFGRGTYKFGIFPSYWKDSWGKPPLLGIVFADNEFLAERLAYDRGILPTPFNCTFQPKIKNLGLNNKK